MLDQTTFNGPIWSGLVITGILTILCHRLDQFPNQGLKSKQAKDNGRPSSNIFLSSPLSTIVQLATIYSLYKYLNKNIFEA